MSIAAGRNASEEITGDDLEAIFDGLAEGIVILDRRRKVLGINRAACEILEVAKEEAVRADGLELFGKPFCAAAAKIRQAVESGQPVDNVLSELRTPAGCQRVLSLSTHVLLDTDDRSRGSVVVFGDVTELVTLRADLARRERLPPTVAETDAPAPADPQEALRSALKATGWNVSQTARHLQLSRTAVYQQIARYGLKRPCST